MKIVFDSITFMLLTGLFLIPIIIAWRLQRLVIQYRFLIYLTIGIFMTSAIAITFGWWTNFSEHKLLEHFGYNFDATNNEERFETVSHHNLELVQDLETSITAVGWPLKVILTYVFYFPYLLFVYPVAHLFRKKIAS